MTFSNQVSDTHVASSPTTQGQDKRPRVDPETVMINIPDDQVKKGRRKIFVLNWEVVNTDTMFPNNEKRQRHVNRELFRAFELPIDRSRFKDSSARDSLAISTNLLAKGCAWFNHALD